MYKALYKCSVLYYYYYYYLFVWLLLGQRKSPHSVCLLVAGLQPLVSTRRDIPALRHCVNYPFVCK